MRKHEVLVHLNVEVVTDGEGEDEDWDMIRRAAVTKARHAAIESREAFEELIALVDPT
jgi:hypothetical protein